MFKLPKIELFKIISVGCKMLNEKNEKDKSKEGLKCQINKVFLDIIGLKTGCSYKIC